MLLQTIRKSGWILVIHLLFCIHMVRGQAYFVPDLRSGCAPLQVNFTNQTAGNHSYVWNLGNGNQPVTTNATANYSTPGTYIVTLTATSQSGVISNFIDTVIVFSKPTASFTVSQQSGCAGGTSFQFTNSSIGATTFIWDFGDGTSSTATNPVHVYAQPGIYCVKLIAESGAGCKDIYIQTNCIDIHALPIASISMNAGGSCDSTTVFQFNASGNGITSWLWNFGDGNTSTLQQTSHTYNSTGSFNVTLLATNTFGCVDTFYTNAPVSIGPTLQPVITATDTNGCAPFPVQFNCGMAGITAWNWNFGDGTTSTYIFQSGFLFGFASDNNHSRM
jgi:PKD repeat protein